ncbi:MAG: hypothetical protein A2541_00095 [Candidatus Taylorbacteria bacterium RIFOXYD2_FULL_36_9]|uniref:Uncharacterized protein n=1 Tax=Candidatus Taylorbacteria bacterium RIFOXYD2_FULL_36_9 TaxID=1802338 RepID=A0A1G2PER1_9BACT|nr:MAG: hypothetical protein A2541_00095 [Candidatus Taylorbacteria bacterium RIFOXYD2_FULL_36_9]
MTAAITGFDSSASNLYTSLIGNTSDGKVWGGIGGTPSGQAWAVYGRNPGSVVDTVVKTDIWCVDSTGKSGNPSVNAVAQLTAATQVAVCW